MPKLKELELTSSEPSKPLLASRSTVGVAPRSWLFVPAMRSDRFIKALNSGADAVIIDLEDAVDTNDKQQARQNVASFMLELEPYSHSSELSFLPQIWLRINNSDQDSKAKDKRTPNEVQLDADIRLCQQLLSNSKPNNKPDNQPDNKANNLPDDRSTFQTSRVKLAGVILPKVSTAAQVRHVTEHLNLPVIAQIESARGISNLTDIVQTPGLQAISYGRLDIANALNLRVGSQAEHDFFGQLRMQMLVASKVHQLMAPVESIYANFKDTEGMSATAHYASDLGFSGMLCIHPSQVAVVNQAFSATEAQLSFAK